MNSRFSSFSDNLGIHLPPVLKLEMHFLSEVVCAFVYAELLKRKAAWGLRARFQSQIYY